VKGVAGRCLVCPLWAFTAWGVLACLTVSVHAQAPKDPATIEAEIAGEQAQEDARVEPMPPVPTLPVLPPAGPAVCERCLTLDRDIDSLKVEHENLGLGLPLGGMVVGYGGALLSAIILTNANVSDSAMIGIGVGGAVLLVGGIVSNFRLRARAARRRAVRSQLLLLELEREELSATPPHREQARARSNRAQSAASELGRVRTQYSKMGLGLPIVMMALGFACAIPMAALTVFASELDLNPLPYAAGLVVSGAAGLAGLGLLVARTRTRRPLARRIRALEAEQRELMPVSFDAAIGLKSPSLLLQLRF